MALFLQYWYWFPMAYILPLSFKCTALIGVTKELKLPKFTVSCNCRKGLHAYAKPVVDNAKKKVRCSITRTIVVLLALETCWCCC